MTTTHQSKNLGHILGLKWPYWCFYSGFFARPHKSITMTTCGDGQTDISNEDSKAMITHKKLFGRESSRGFCERGLLKAMVLRFEVWQRICRRPSSVITHSTPRCWREIDNCGPYIFALGRFVCSIIILDMTDAGQEDDCDDLERRIANRRNFFQLLAFQRAHRPFLQRRLLPRYTHLLKLKPLIKWSSKKTMKHVRR